MEALAKLSDQISAVSTAFVAMQQQEPMSPMGCLLPMYACVCVCVYNFPAWMHIMACIGVHEVPAWLQWIYYRVSIACLNEYARCACRDV